MTVKLGINSGTFSLQGVDLPAMMEAVSKAGFKGIDLWDSHIREYIQKGGSLRDLKALLGANGLHPISINSLREWQSWDVTGGGTWRREVEQYMDMAEKIGCDCIVCPAFGEERNTQRDTQNFKKICDTARPAGIRIALEFLPWAALRDLRTAWNVVREADCPNGGLLIDTFHFFKGGSDIRDLGEIPNEKIFFFHINDAVDSPMDLREMCMHHRSFPGEGVFPLSRFFDVLLSDKGYDGWIVLEVLNRENQKVDYHRIVAKSFKSLETLLGPHAGSIKIS